MTANWRNFENIPGLKHDNMEEKKRYKNSIEYIKKAPSKIIWEPSKKDRETHQYFAQGSKKSVKSGIKTFKRRQDNWLKTAPDEPKIDFHRICVAVENKSIVKQTVYSMRAMH